MNNDDLGKDVDVAFKAMGSLAKWGIGIWLAWLALCAFCTIVAVYVAVHFITKFW